MKLHLYIILIWLLVLSCHAQSAAHTEDTGNTIAFASDTQAPLWVESLFLKEKNNRKATSLVFGEITRAHPLGLFIFGDVVSLGCKNKAWTAMDVYLATARKSGIPVCAALGNHDLMRRPTTGMRKFQKRFPQHSPTGYLEVMDSVAIILLNSNFSIMTKAEIKKQEQWLIDTLNALDHNAAVKAVIMGCHHSPYTNSKIVKPSTEVQEQFVKPFLASKKAKLFISGHAHAFEYYKMQGKDFLVIGGGGGLHQPLNTGKDKLDDQASQYKPMFHYLTVKVRGNKLVACSRYLREDFSGFEDGFSIEISLE
jgi:hypothetical protein